MPGYLPYAGRHSIQEAVIAVHFATRVESRVADSAYSALRGELAEEFPRANLIEMAEMKVSASPVPGTNQAPRLTTGGFELSRLRAEGKPGKMLRLVGDIVSVNYLEYDSWQDALPRSVDLLRLTLSKLDLENNPVVAFSLRFIDRFTFDGPPDDAQADKLFQRGSQYIAARCFDSGNLWHCHTGWFRMNLDEEGSRVLHQLNVGSQFVDQAPTVRVDHNAVCQLKTPRQSLETVFQTSARSKVELVRALDNMHDENKAILKDMLLPDMVKQIGL